MSSGREILLVLNLDETLIHASGMELEDPADLRVAGYYVYRRPGLEAFLEICFANFAVGIWSSASDGYVAEIVGHIVPDAGRLMFVWGASRVTQMRTLPHHNERFGRDLGDFHTQKRLKKLKRFGWPLERILIVDDSPPRRARRTTAMPFPSRRFWAIQPMLSWNFLRLFWCGFGGHRTCAGSRSGRGVKW